MPKPLSLACIVLALSASPLSAMIRAEFREGAPKDSFVLTHDGACPLGPLSVEIDLSGSAGGLIFDVTERGAGLSVYQPFEVEEGAALLASVSDVRDGDTALRLDLRAFPPGETIRFTIDLDDTAGASQTVISEAEIAGATLRVTGAFGVSEGRFDTGSMAEANVAACLS